MDDLQVIFSDEFDSLVEQYLANCDMIDDPEVGMSYYSETDLDDADEHAIHEIEDRLKKELEAFKQEKGFVSICKKAKETVSKL